MLCFFEETGIGALFEDEVDGLPDGVSVLFCARESSTSFFLFSMSFFVPGKTPKGLSAAFISPRTRHEANNIPQALAFGDSALFNIRSSSLESVVCA